MTATQTLYISIALFCTISSGCSKQKAELAPETTLDPQQIVQNCFDKARRKEGQYFANVYKIVETKGGIPALIAVLDSTNQQDAVHAHGILCRLSVSLSDSRQLAPNLPKDSAYWNTWWKQKGSKMSRQTMWSNFDSYWK